MAHTCRPSTSMSTSPTAPISRPPGSFAQPSTSRYGFGNACAHAAVGALSAASMANTESDERLVFVMPYPSSAARRAPASRTRLAFRPEPALALALVNGGFVVGRRAGHVVDAFALRVDVAFDVAAVAALRLRRAAAAALRRAVLLIVVAVVLGIRELAGPDAAARRARLVLLIDVVVAVASICRSEPRAHHLRADVGRAAAAHGDGTPVVVDVALRARDGAIADQAFELARRFVAASPAAPLACARLPAFGRVDPEEPHARRADLERVAIGDVRTAADAFLRNASGFCAQHERGESEQGEAGAQPHG